VILLDTNVISALMHPDVEPAVAVYIDAQPQDDLFTSCVCEAEVKYRLMRLPTGRRRTALMVAFENLLTDWFQDHIVVFDRACAAAYAEIRVRRAIASLPIATPDAMIAATALAHGAILATRNVADFAACGITVQNPWDPI
jgi:predicted nucleic acid-binding protein